MNNKWIIAILLAIIAVMPFGILAYLNQNHSMEPSQDSQSVAIIDYITHEERAMEPGAEFKIAQCHVVDGYKFGVLLENGEWIIAHLPVATKDEATRFVVELLRESQAPTVILRRKLDEHWIVDFHLTVDGKETIP